MLSVRAVGVERTLCVLLPCHSQSEDAAYAMLLVEAAGLQATTVDLTETYDALKRALPAGVDMAYANIRPRLRMTRCISWRSRGATWSLGRATVRR